MTGTKNRAFEGEEGETSDRHDGHNNGGNEASSFSRKIFPHGIHGPDISKFVGFDFISYLFN
jgi:hypothetical protein